MLFINPAPLIFFLGGGEVHLLCLPYCFFFLRGDVCLYNFIRSCPFKPAGIEKRKTRVLLSTLSVVFTLGVWKGEEKKKKKDPFFLLIVLWPALLYFFQVPPPPFFLRCELFFMVLGLKHVYVCVWWSHASCLGSLFEARTSFCLGRLYSP